MLLILEERAMFGLRCAVVVRMTLEESVDVDRMTTEQDGVLLTPGGGEARAEEVERRSYVLQAALCATLVSAKSSRRQLI